MTNSSAATVPSPSDLDENATMTVADALKIILANSYAVYLKTKNFHWHVSGPYFRDYHLLLDEQAAEILAATDAMAERARKTGNTTIRSIGDIARHQTIKDNDAEFVTPQDMLAELRADNLHMVEIIGAQRTSPTRLRTTRPPALSIPGPTRRNAVRGSFSKSADKPAAQLIGSFHGV